MRIEGAERSGRNCAVHRLLVEGVTVEYGAADGEIRAEQARVFDFDNAQNSRRPDVDLFVNAPKRSSCLSTVSPADERISGKRLPRSRSVKKTTLKQRARTARPPRSPTA